MNSIFSAMLVQVDVAGVQIVFQQHQQFFRRAVGSLLRSPV